MPAKASEVKQLNRIAAGEFQPFEQLYLATAGDVFRYLARLLGEGEKANDVLVATYLYVWRNASEYKAKQALNLWLLIQARARALEKIQNTNFTSLQLAQALSVNSRTLDREKLFAHAIMALSWEEREPLGLILMPNLTYHEAAGVLHTTIDEYKGKVFKAKAALKEQLKQQGAQKQAVSQSSILRELIPLYINGSLGGKHKKAFEKSLKGDKELKQEYVEFYEIESFFDQQEGVIKTRLPQLFNIIKSEIKDVKPKTEIVVPAPAETPAAEIAQGVVHQLLSSARIGWGLAILQLAILIIVIMVNTPRYTNQSYATSKAGVQPAVKNGKRINVVFADDAKAQDIKDLLLKLKVELDGGPSDIGSFSVLVQGSESHVNKVVEKLKQSDIVVVAMPAY